MLPSEAVLEFPEEPHELQEVFEAETLKGPCLLKHLHPGIGERISKNQHSTRVAFAPNGFWVVGLKFAHM